MIDKVICRIFGHKWFFVGRTEETEYGPNYNPGIEVYECSRCGITCTPEEEIG
jgi:hypothetical protein